MRGKYFLIHVCISLTVGGLIALFSDIRWLAAALWVSAAMFINGSVAYVEDGQPGGFDNPDGDDTPEYAAGPGASWFALKSFAIMVVLFTAGVLVQKW